MPRLLLQAGHLVTVEQLREAAELIVHHAASVVPGASQRAQEELPVSGVASQLGGGDKGLATETLDWIVHQHSIESL